MSAVLGVLFAVLFGMAAMPALIKYEQTGADNAKVAATAQQLKQMDDAVQGFVQTNFATIKTTATASVPYGISVAALQTAGYLPAGFASLNPYGQTWAAQVLQPSAGNLQALVLSSGGIAIGATKLAQIASQTGSQGGFVPYAGQFAIAPGTGMSNANAYGVYGGWQVSLIGYTNPGSGHLVGLNYFNNGSLTNSYLYRNAVPGNPGLNTMNTPLIMAAVQTTGSACTTAGAIAQDGSGAVVSCQGGVWKSSASASYWKDPVPAESALPSAGNNKGDVRLSNLDQRAYAWSGSAWVPLAIDMNGNMLVPGVLTANQMQINGVATVGAVCSPNGLVAQNGSGVLLSCQSSVWQQQGWSPGVFHDVTASRSAGVSYTNNTGKAILDTVYINTNPSAWAYCYVNGVEVSASSQTNYGVDTHMFFVPPGGTYSCSGSIAGIALWGEQY